MERSLYSYRYVKHPFDEIVEQLETAPDSVMQAATDTAADDVRRFVSHLHVDLQGFEIGRDIVVEVGRRVPMGVHTVVFPVTWTASTGEAIFPAMTGNVEVAAMSFAQPLTQLTFSGRYRPPLGPIGALADVAVGRRVAEAAVHHFLEDLVARLDRQLAHSSMG
ncbi:MAG: acyl-CoA reductase-like NAD-dependent aldehyde dehydrogenase [Glaciecola sp.]|jgi:acyl-CoA reductase-like NAD-dependent aldehyde dehydrogenase